MIVQNPRHTALAICMLKAVVYRYRYDVFIGRVLLYIPQNTELVKTVEDLKLQLSGRGSVSVTSGDQQKVGSTASISPSHTHPQAAAPGPRHQVPFGEDDEQVIATRPLS